MLNQATPGTIVVLAATILLILVTVSTPIDKTFTFLTANLTVSREGLSVSGTITMGVFGYCLDTLDKVVCSNTTLGYSVDANELLGIPNSIELGISNSVIKGLTYVLVLHPVAAGFAALATLSGALSHIREFSDSCFTSCFASIGATFALFAFVFDIIVFSIAKSRISSSIGGAASLGNAVWMTLVAFILLAFSGCFFCAGRCLLRRKRAAQSESDKSRPQADYGFAGRMRQDAEDAEKRRAEAASGGDRRAGGASGLPAFAEYGNEELQHEAIPLNSMEPDGADERFSDRTGDHHHLLAQPTQPARNGSGIEMVDGVGMGYGRRARFAPSAHSGDITSPTSAYSPNLFPSTPSNVSSALGGIRQGTSLEDPYSGLPSHVEPATAYMSPRNGPEPFDDPNAVYARPGEAYPGYGEGSGARAVLGEGVGAFSVGGSRGYRDPFDEAGYGQDVMSPTLEGSHYGSQQDGGYWSSSSQQHLFQPPFAGVGEASHNGHADRQGSTPLPNPYDDYADSLHRTTASPPPSVAGGYGKVDKREYPATEPSQSQEHGKFGGYSEASMYSETPPTYR